MKNTIIKSLNEGRNNEPKSSNCSRPASFRLRNKNTTPVIAAVRIESRREGRLRRTRKESTRHLTLPKISIVL